MARSTPSANPLETLHDLTTALEAAALECLANPRKGSVHRLRTSTRRIEAQLELFSLLPKVPPHSKLRDKAMKLLEKLRSAAGKVRDLDVQRDLLQSEVAPKNHPSTAVRDEARKLSRALKQEREEEGDDLLALLKKQRAKLPLVLKNLLDALAPAGSLTLTEPKLIALVRDWYSGQCGTTPTAKPPQDLDRLHDIRKKAKLARYLAESAPGSAARAHRLAEKYEELQQAGGTWHDWLLLADVAAGELGKSANLVDRFKAHADSALGIYKRKLTHKI
ncbi:MAG TPA: CHAD domain-containing protein [Acidobacteriaceae bacterium]